MKHKAPVIHYFVHLPFVYYCFYLSFLFRQIPIRCAARQTTPTSYRKGILEEGCAPYPRRSWADGVEGEWFLIVWGE